MSPIAVRSIALAGALLVLGAVNYSIYAKQQIVRNGVPIRLELAPVDPRSLMQGDYMALRFRLADAIEASRSRSPAESSRRSAPLSVDARGVATLGASAADDTLRIRYRIRNGEVWIVTNAYFFSEGSADRYAQARYGEFRVDRDSGEAVLVGLEDEAFGDL